MSQELIDIAKRLAEAVSSRDWDAAGRLMHPDVELKTTLQGTYRGRSEVKRFLDDQSEPFEEIRVEPEESFVDGDRIAVTVRIRYRPRGTSVIPPEVRTGHLLTVRDGKIARWETFPKREDARKALEAAGLSERDAHVNSS